MSRHHIAGNWSAHLREQALSGDPVRKAQATIAASFRARGAAEAHRLAYRQKAMGRITQEDYDTACEAISAMKLCQRNKGVRMLEAPDPEAWMPCGNGYRHMSLEAGGLR